MRCDMGEYAIRKSDGERIKIGTCEDMYYLRFSDRHLVQAQPGNVDPVKDVEHLRFRLPFPDEDHVLPGNYDDYNRAARLIDFEGDESDKPGIFQVHHESGLLLNLPCYHGTKLPEVGPGVKAFWNGKSWFYELYQLRGMADGSVLPVVHCRFCREAWRYQWATVWNHIPKDLRIALRPLMKQSDPEYAKVAA